MPHQLVSIKAILGHFNTKVFAFSYEEPHDYSEKIDNLESFRLEQFDRNSFLQKLFELKPEIMVVAGWATKDFVWAAKKFKKVSDIPIVACSDTQWRNTLKQNINSLISPLHLKRAFTHMWVSGVYQYEYARKLGFEKDQILFNSLSCDFEKFYNLSLSKKFKKYPKNFLFIGRFIPLKGLDILLNAWKNIEDKGGWTLTLIGDGILKNDLKIDDNDIIIKDYMPQKELLLEIETSGCFILPSNFEQWGLVLHETSAAGLPIIATEVCGATTQFLINNFNGYKVKPKVVSLQKAMEKIILSSNSDLLLMAENSKKLATSITPELGAAQLLSVIK